MISKAVVKPGRDSYRIGMSFDFSNKYQGWYFTDFSCFKTHLDEYSYGDGTIGDIFILDAVVDAFSVLSEQDWFTIPKELEGQYQAILDYAIRMPYGVSDRNDPDIDLCQQSLDEYRNLVHDFLMASGLMVGIEFDYPVYADDYVVDPRFANLIIEHDTDVGGIGIDYHTAAQAIHDSYVFQQEVDKRVVEILNVTMDDTGYPSDAYDFADKVFDLGYSDRFSVVDLAELLDVTVETAVKWWPVLLQDVSNKPFRWDVSDYFEEAFSHYYVNPENGELVKYEN